jgi:hypothetical protein
MTYGTVRIEFVFISPNHQLASRTIIFREIEMTALKRSKPFRNLEDGLASVGSL